MEIYNIDIPQSFFDLLILKNDGSINIEKSIIGENFAEIRVVKHNESSDSSDNSNGSDRIIVKLYILYIDNRKKLVTIFADRDIKDYRRKSKIKNDDNRNVVMYGIELYPYNIDYSIVSKLPFYCELYSSTQIFKVPLNYLDDINKLTDYTIQNLMIENIIQLY